MSAYLALIYKDETGMYFAEFPDLDGCITQAPSLEELGGMLRDAMYTWMDKDQRQGKNLPEPSTFEQALKHVLPDEEFVAATLVTMPKKVLVERITLSLREPQLDAIDTAAEARGMTRSEFMVSAAIKEASAAA